jgi:hypothetical protein
LFSFSGVSRRIPHASDPEPDLIAHREQGIRHQVFLISKTISLKTIMDTTPELPAFNLTDTDREVLAMTDDQFVPHDWDNLKDIIGMTSRS